MGKATLYHPVSLTVIRAAAIACNWKFGKIKQEWANEDTFTACYLAEIDLGKTGYILVERDALIHQVQECFADDVLIRDIWTTRSGRILVKFETSIDPKELPGLSNANLVDDEATQVAEVHQIADGMGWLR